jgi:hypothetical protein
MDRAETYRRKAEEAERQAASAPSPVEREAFKKIAQHWRDLEADVLRSEKRGL